MPIKKIDSSVRVGDDTIDVTDTHCHAGLDWFEPIEMLICQMDLCDVKRAVLVQHRGQYDNTYLLKCAERFPGRFSVVGMIDISCIDAPATLEKWSTQGITGLRLDASSRSPGKNQFTVWEKASDLGLVISCSGTTEEFASSEFKGLVAQYQDMNIIIEHMAGAKPDTKSSCSIFAEALELSKYPNTYIKIGGLGEIISRPKVLNSTLVFPHSSPLIKIAIEAFGSHRVMWGSDYPPVSGREGYNNALIGVTDSIQFLPSEEIEGIMGKNADNLFNFTS